MQTLQDRWERKVDRTPGWGPNGDCWKWTGAIFGSGYGCLMDEDRRITGAHRIAWKLKHKRPAPSRLDVMHSCDWKPCVRWDHLVLGTRSRNMIDAVVRGLMPGTARLTPELVELIRADRGPSREVGVRFGVSGRTVRRIRHGDIWVTSS